MATMIEALETRTFLSVSPLSASHHVGQAAPHVSAPAAPALLFQGSQVDSKGNVVATLSMLLSRSGAGYRDVVTVTNASGKVSKVTISINAAGHFSYSNGDGGRFHVEGQLSADKSSISGMYKQIMGRVTTTGTINLTAASTDSTTQNSTPSNTTGGNSDNGGSNGDTKTSVATFTGLATDSTTGTHNNLSLTLTATSAGATGVLSVVNGNGSTSTYPFTLNSNHTFSFTTASDGKTVHVSGTLNSNATITGNYAASSADGGSSSGTFSLSMNGTGGSGAGGSTTPTSPTSNGGGSDSNGTTEASVANYTGLATNAVDGTTNNLTLTITATSSAVGGVLNVVNGDGTTTSFSFTVNSDRTFNFYNTHGGETDHIAGSVSSDGKTITGTYAVAKADVLTAHGTFSLTRT